MNNKTNLTSPPLSGGLEGGLKIERYIFDNESTRGMLSVDDMVIGCVEEPVHITKAGTDDFCAIPEGIYVVSVQCNPMDGSPVIKVKGQNIRSNVAIRALKPISKKNASITFWNEEMNVKSNIRKWAELLNYLVEVGGEATLEIKTLSPTLSR